MLSENEIVNRFRHRGMTRGAGSLYLEIPIALDFLATCEANNLAIIGVEGFLYNDKKDTIQPIMDYIEDYSDIEAPHWKAYRNLCNQRCRDFLCHLPSKSEFVVNLVVISQAEWQQSAPIEIVVSSSAGKVVNL